MGHTAALQAQPNAPLPREKPEAGCSPCHERSRRQDAEQQGTARHGKDETRLAHPFLDMLSVS